MWVGNSSKIVFEGLGKKSDPPAMVRRTDYFTQKTVFND